MKDLNSRFLVEISKIKDPEVFIGIARILRVKLMSEQKDEEGRFVPRDFTDLYSDTLMAFAQSERKRKRELLKIIEKANKEKDEKGAINANRTKDSKENISNEKV